MFHTSGSDVMAQISVVLESLAPIYALAFGLMALQALLNKTLKAVFPNYDPKKGRKRSSSKSASSARANSKKKSTTKTTSTRKQTPKPYMVGAKAPLKRKERTMRFLEAAMMGEVHRSGDKVYISYSHRGERTNLVFNKDRNVKYKKIGETIEFSYD